MYPCGICNLPANYYLKQYPNPLIIAIENKHVECLKAWVEAGLYLDNGVFEAPKAVKIDRLDHTLKHFFQKSIRKYLLKINKNEHLFHRIPKLGLPTIINEYLLHNIKM